MNGIDEYRALLERHGRPLDAAGSREVGLSREYALKAIECLRNSGVAILGGDVYRFVGDRPQSELDNWYCQRRDDETRATFQMRSTEEAMQYVRDYPDPGEGIVFSLVIAGS